MFEHMTTIRVRYSETDQMGTFYNSRVLEWFEVGRTELFRAAGISYASTEDKNVLLPLVEASLRFEGRARYDDELTITSKCAMDGRASLRFDVNIVHASLQKPVASGGTRHAITDRAGKPIRPPHWLVQAISAESE